MIVCCACMSAAAQQKTGITVIWKGNPVQTDNRITLKTVSEGKISREEAAEAVTNNDGSKTYELVAEQPQIMYLGGFPIYISGDGDLTVALTGEGYEIVSGRVSPENRALMDWTAITSRISDNSLRGGSPQSFFERFEQAVNQTNELAAGLDTGNPEFDANLKKLMRYTLDYQGLSYILMFGSTVGRENYPDYFNTILTPGRFDDELVLTMPSGDRFLSLLKTYNAMEKGGSDRNAFLELIGSPTLRNKLLFDELQYIPSAYEMRKVLEDYAAELDEENIAALNVKLDEIVAANNRDAIDFTFPDVDGNMVSLSDFSGKVILIDVWATWCGPCKYQLPYLLELEEKFHGNPDIVFMGVSTDKQKDYDKWAEMVRNGEVVGIQLFSDGGGQFSKDYSIKGIPRFVIIDRNGRIVEMNGPRPSNPLLEQLLRELLND